MISTAVVAHQARLEAATELAKTIGAVISLDDGSLGAGTNHVHAWELTQARNGTWAAVLEDDAEPVPGFVRQAEQALAVAPEPLVSFYAGTTRPKCFQTSLRPAAASADRVGACWLTTTIAAHAVAIAMHVDLREDWIDFAADNALPPDERLTAWLQDRGHRIAYSWPSLCDHADGPTLVRHGNTQGVKGPRKAWRTGTRDHWNSKAIPM